MMNAHAYNKVMSNPDLSKFTFDSKLAIPHRVAELMHYLVRNYPGRSVEPRVCVRACLGLQRVAKKDVQVEIFMRKYLRAVRKIVKENGVYVIVKRVGGIRWIRPTFDADDKAENVIIPALNSAGNAHARAAEKLMEVSPDEMKKPFNKLIISAAQKSFPAISRQTRLMLESIKKEKDRVREEEKEIARAAASAKKTTP